MLHECNADEEQEQRTPGGVIDVRHVCQPVTHTALPETIRHAPAHAVQSPAEKYERKSSCGEDLALGQHQKGWRVQSSGGNQKQVVLHRIHSRWRRKQSGCTPGGGFEQGRQAVGVLEHPSCGRKLHQLYDKYNGGAQVRQLRWTPVLFAIAHEQRLHAILKSQRRKSSRSQCKAYVSRPAAAAAGGAAIHG